MPRGPRPEPSTPPQSGSPRAGSRAKGSSRRGGPLGPEAAGTDRSAQVAAEIRRAVQSEIGRGLNDPRVQGIVSVTEVGVSPDGSEARIRVSVLPAERASLTLSGLRAAAGFLRRRVMDETRIGRVPRLLFEVDERLKRQSALDAALESSQRAGAPGAISEAGDAADGTGPRPETGSSPRVTGAVARSDPKRSAAKESEEKRTR